MRLPTITISTASVWCTQDRLRQSDLTEMFGKAPICRRSKIATHSFVKPPAMKALRRNLKLS